MDEADWPSFPASLLEAPAEEWGRLPGGGRGWKQGSREAAQQQSDEEASAANLLADLEEAFAGARGDVDRAKALETMQTFLSVRRVRLLEDLMLLDLSLGGGGGGGGNGAEEDEQKRWETTGGRGIGNADSSSSSNNRGSPTAFSGGDAVGGVVPPSFNAASTAAAAATARTRHLSGTMDLNRELAFARQKLQELNPAPNASGVENQNVDDTVTLTAAATAAAGKSAGAPSLSMAGNSACSACHAGALDEAKVKGVGVLLREGGVEEEGLRAAAEESTEAFFVAWAERFGHLIVSLGLGGEQGGDGEGGGVAAGGGGGGGRKDDREIQAARDVERDILCVNGVLVVGSEGYSAVVGRVKRELGRVADPVAGPDGAPLVVQGGAGAGAAAAAAAGEGGGGDGPSLSSKSMPVPDTSSREICPLRPPRQLENFSKLVLKAANRTESGGLSFDAIHRVMELCPGACDGSVLVVPDSSKAEPLGITVSAEAYTEKGSAPFALPESVGSAMLKDGLHTFGICARIEAVTVYSLYSADMEHVHLRLRATFRSSMRLALSPVSNVTCEAFADVGYRGEQGSVEIEVVEGSHASGH